RFPEVSIPPNITSTGKVSLSARVSSQASRSPICATPSLPRVSTPSLPRVSTPSLPRVTTPSLPRVSTPS
uniref:Uncharacterized protein n=1 Tax=Ciona intestinalis TaxID=7719 RepID=H2XZV7_CIOIN